jgi:hypothetical protein
MLFRYKSLKFFHYFRIWDADRDMFGLGKDAKRDGIV